MKNFYKAPHVEVVEIEIEDAVMVDSGVVGKANGVDNLNKGQTVHW